MSTNSKVSIPTRSLIRGEKWEKEMEWAYNLNKNGLREICRTNESITLGTYDNSSKGIVYWDGKDFSTAWTSLLRQRATMDLGF